MTPSAARNLPSSLRTLKWRREPAVVILRPTHPRTGRSAARGTRPGQVSSATPVRSGSSVVARAARQKATANTAKTPAAPMPGSRTGTSSGAMMLAMRPKPAAAPQAAVCEVTLGGARIDGPCRFTPRKGGSFDIRMDDGRRFGGAESLSLDVTGKGRGRLSGSDGRAWGTARRQADGACWAATGLTVCVRDPGDAPGAGARGGTPPTEAELAEAARAALEAR